jgi:hypothetical protein
MDLWRMALLRGTCMRSGHNVRSKDRVFWTIWCEICGTDRAFRSGGTFLHQTPRSTPYFGNVSFHPHALCSALVPKSTSSPGEADGGSGVPPFPILCRRVPTETTTFLPSSPLSCGGNGGLATVAAARQASLGRRHKIAHGSLCFFLKSIEFLI